MRLAILEGFCSVRGITDITVIFNLDQMLINVNSIFANTKDTFCGNMSAVHWQVFFALLCILTKMTSTIICKD